MRPIWFTFCIIDISPKATKMIFINYFIFDDKTPPYLANLLKCRISNLFYLICEQSLLNINNIFISKILFFNSYIFINYF